MPTDMTFDILFDKQRQEYLTTMRKLFSNYMQRPKKIQSNQLLSFCRWPAHCSANASTFSYEDHQALFNAKNSDVQEGGYFLCLNQKGICINPGLHFFEELCQKGFTLRDIDVVIATRPNFAIQEAIEQLHSLNREACRTLVSYGQEPHIIRYFLHPEIHANLSAHLRPIFREEMGSVLSLETFTKFHETKELDEELSLCYTKSEGVGLALRIDYKKEDISFGYLSGGGYHEGLKEFFLPCSIFLAAIGESLHSDLEMLDLQSDTLGFYGIVKCLESQSNLKVALVSEFSRRMGDVRLELVAKLKNELGQDHTILPVDQDFCMQLDMLLIQTQENTFCSFDEAKVVRQFGSFGPLHFLSANDVL